MKSQQPQKSEIVIGKTTYIVSTFFNENSCETAEDKLAHLVTKRISEDINGKKNTSI
jgi:hypothetical protein